MSGAEQLIDSCNSFAHSIDFGQFPLFPYFVNILSQVAQADSSFAICQDFIDIFSLVFPSNSENPQSTEMYSPNLES